MSISGPKVPAANCLDLAYAADNAATSRHPVEDLPGRHCQRGAGVADHLSHVLIACIAVA